ncbi:class I SAM-dependent methyltransferase [Pelagibaculum spongiae]|uniref:Ribosomal RNA small subunit methyltransferase C n=1 Tax=Pelagibaculum spongiae TaxID=2080658 RepID=A0A2V1GYD2_9GAMM|nr:class I SAM-dependent methyltransferase [Pelagibaculum spongiae]PVZ67674.1 16S rRNA methyltransferase [Pelagibaculum spongiae]
MSKALSNPVILLEKNLSEISCNHPLIANPPVDAGHLALNDPRFFCTDYSDYRQLQQQQKSVTFGHSYQAKTPHDGLILFWPKSKERAAWMLSTLLPQLTDTAEIWLIGDNRGGIKSGINQQADFFSETTKWASGKHCQLFKASAASILPATPASRQWNIPQTELTIQSLPGVFSHGRLDEGTQLLLEHLPNSKPGKLLDFGCGAGVLGAIMASKGWQSDMVDVDALAIESSKQTLASNGLFGNVFASDVYSDVQDKYDLLLSNPPFHKGVDTHYLSSERFIQHAKTFLKPGGEIRIVANRFLKYQPLLEKLGTTELIAQNNQFRIWSCRLR